MRHFCWIILVFCIGCDTGTPLYWPIAPQLVTVKGVQFEVRDLRRRAQAIRITNLWFPDTKTILPLALDAIRSVTGCADITPLAADPSVITARLNCPSIQDP